VHQADRLAQLVTHLHAGTGVIGVVVDPDRADQGVEMGWD